MPVVLDTNTQLKFIKISEMSSKKLPQKSLFCVLVREVMGMDGLRNCRIKEPVSASSPPPLVGQEATPSKCHGLTLSVAVSHDWAMLSCSSSSSGSSAEKWD